MTRRTKSQWRELIDQQNASGLTAAEFCRRHELNPKYFSLRKKKLIDSQIQPSNEFVQVTPSLAKDVDPATDTIKLRVTEVELPMNLTARLDTLPQLLGKLLR